MNVPAYHPDKTHPSWANKWLWAVFILYLALTAYAMAHHEVWSDEVHSWNIAKGSGSYADLIRNTRFEGHPPAWFSILWSISRFTHNIACVQAAHWVIAGLVVFMILFLSPFPFFIRMLIPFGYYFLFEYALFSRNYALGVLFAFCLCLIIRKEFKYKLILYYGLLGCLSNVHLLALLLAGSLHLYFLLFLAEQQKKKRLLVLHGILGLLIFLPALYFIFPPSDSQINMHFWLGRWQLQHLTDLAQPPLRAFFPMPAWWNYHFWNTEFLLEAKDNHRFLRLINPLLAGTITTLLLIPFRKNKKSLALFAGNLLLSLFVALVFLPLTSARYAGYLYISFIVTAWLYCYEAPLSGNRQRFVYLLLVIQLFAGVFAVTRDIKLPFSRLYQVNELIKEVPANEKWVTDYWTMNAIVAFTDRPVYCVDLEKEISFITWTGDMALLQNNPHRYSGGMLHLFQNSGISTVYMISQSPPDLLSRVDPSLSSSFHMALIDKRDGAIEQGSNLYLYQIKKR